MKKKILLVDDDKFLIRTYGYKLEAEGYEIMRLESGVEVLATAKDKKPDLILLDMVMPEKNGMQVLKELRADNDAKNIPVIIVSGLSQQKDIDEALALGAKKYLVKSSIGFHDLKDAVDGTFSV